MLRLQMPLDEQVHHSGDGVLPACSGDFGLAFRLLAFLERVGPVLACGLENLCDALPGLCMAVSRIVGDSERWQLGAALDAAKYRPGAGHLDGIGRTVSGAP